jgi:hypothetical protein
VALMGAGSPPKGPPVRYGHSYADMRNAYGTMEYDQYLAAGMRNVASDFEIRTRPDRIVLPGEVFRYIDEDEGK